MSGDSPNPFDSDDDDNSKNMFGSMFGNMFGNMPMFGDMMKMFNTQGPIQWDTARQIALVTATDGQTEPNVDPLVRIEYANLARIAGMHVHQITGLGDISTASSVEPVMVTPGAWAQRTLDDYRPLFTQLATALSSHQNEPTDSSSESDPFATMFAGITNMIAPMTMGMTVGSMVGHLAKKSLGQYDLPLPRPVKNEIAIVPATVDTFAAKWDLPLEDVRMWTLIRELVVHQLYSVTHIRDAVTDMVQSFIAGFRPDPSAITDKLSNLDSTDPNELMGSLQKILGDPELMLGAVRSEEQNRLQPQLDALLGLIIGWSDHMTDAVGSRVLGNPSRIAEAARRRRIESGEETIFVEKLLGLHINRQQVERGRNFVQGVIERMGEDGLTPLYVSAASLPTLSELDAPGLWLARLEFSADD
ncbi:MAG: zinc-dependent metalloprotease [Actinomycetota bacterium]|nr:zinc-dependent metalloprotease [Actinomycetota bacterium]MDA3019136.1 zinc-dependent metalloprotease [Actinomycetota bacterium]